MGGANRREDPGDYMVTAFKGHILGLILWHSIFSNFSIRHSVRLAECIMDSWITLEAESSLWFPREVQLLSPLRLESGTLRTGEN